MASRETSAIKIQAANEEALRVIEAHDPEAAASIRNIAPHAVNPEKQLWAAFAHQTAITAALAQRVEYLDELIAAMLEERAGRAA